MNYISKKNLMIPVILLISLTSAFSLDVTLSKINVFADTVDVTLTREEEDLTKKLFNDLIAFDFKGKGKILRVDPAYGDKEIKSNADAAELCETAQINFLLFGNIRKTNKFYDAELRLYDNEKKEVRKVFYEKVEIGLFDELVKNISTKCTNYLSDILGISESVKAGKNHFGGVNVYNGAGYYIPMDKWWELDTGLFSIETGVSIEPLSYIAKRSMFSFFLRYGLYAGYSMGISKPDYLKSYYHTIVIKTPVESCFALNSDNVFIFGIGPQLQIDVLYQKRLYDNGASYATASASMFLSAGFERWMGKNRNCAVGISNIFDLTFYKVFYADYKVLLYATVKVTTPIDKSDFIKKDNGEAK